MDEESEVTLATVHSVITVVSGLAVVVVNKVELVITLTNSDLMDVDMLLK